MVCTVWEKKSTKKQKKTKKVDGTSNLKKKLSVHLVWKTQKITFHEIWKKLVSMHVLWNKKLTENIVAKKIRLCICLEPINWQCLIRWKIGSRCICCEKWGWQSENTFTPVCMCHSAPLCLSLSILHPTHAIHATNTAGYQRQDISLQLAWPYPRLPAHVPGRGGTTLVTVSTCMSSGYTCQPTNLVDCFTH